MNAVSLAFPLMKITLLYYLLSTTLHATDAWAWFEKWF